jgi:hypothetical protein
MDREEIKLVLDDQTRAHPPGRWYGACFCLYVGIIPWLSLTRCVEMSSTYHWFTMP